MNDMAATPIYGKKSFIFLLQHESTDALATGYVASGEQVHFHFYIGPIQIRPWFDLDTFYGKVELGLFVYV